MSTLHEKQTAFDAISKLLADVRYKNWHFNLCYDPTYLQVVFLDNGGNIQHGRKWLLSEHMTKSEVLQTALKAVLAAEEHEARERFTYKARAVYGPHINVDCLFSMANTLDVPSAMYIKKHFPSGD